jgi:hypothetical protein
MSDDGEVDDALNISEGLVHSLPRESPRITSIDLDGLLPIPLQIQEDVTEGCGGRIWPAGRVLAKYMLRYADRFYGKTMFVSTCMLLY